MTRTLSSPPGTSPSSPGGLQVPGYQVGRLLGVGGTAEVWAATRLCDGRQCAVKVIGRQRRSLSTLSSSAAEEGRELAVLRGLQHPHVVQLIEDLVLADGRTGLVLELVPGGSLARVVRARGHLTPGETVTLMTALGATLADLHRLGITHGDLAPGNVLFHLDGRPMLTDVGMAGIAGAGDDTAGGTIGFVDPAVLVGARDGSATDVYAVGALGWFALTGAPPAAAPLRPPLVTLAPATPAGLAAVVEAALDPDPERRPSAADLARAAHLAGPASPVRLAGDRDPADLLTHRIRDWAAVAPPVPARRSPGPRFPVGWLRAAVATVALVSCLTATLLATIVAQARPTPAQSAAGASTTHVTAAGANAPLARPTWPALVAELTAARAHAFGRPEDGPASFDRPGSTAWRDDQTALDRLRQVGLRYRGLRIEPTDCAVRSESAQRAELRVTYRTSAYDVVDGSGAVVAHRPALGLTTVRLTVELATVGWRVTRTLSDG